MGHQTRLRGRVLDYAGDAVADATVIIVEAPGPTPDIAAVSDAEGGFVFGGLRAGAYRLRATGPDGEEGEADARVPAAEAVAIRLHAMADS